MRNMEKLFLGAVVVQMTLMLDYTLHALCHQKTGLLAYMVQILMFQNSGKYLQLLTNRFATLQKQSTMLKLLTSLVSSLLKLLTVQFANQGLSHYHNKVCPTSTLSLLSYLKLLLLVLFHSFLSLMMLSTQDH